MSQTEVYHRRSDGLPFKDLSMEESEIILENLYAFVIRKLETLNWYCAPFYLQHYYSQRLNSPYA